MEQTVLVLAAVVAGGLFAVAAVWVVVVGPLMVEARKVRRRLAASIESTRDMGYLMERQRATYAEQVRTYELILDMALRGADALMRERDEARSAVGLALTFYGREVERREAAEVALERERVVSEGLARWTAVGS